MVPRVEHLWSGFHKGGTPLVSGWPAEGWKPLPERQSGGGQAVVKEAALEPPLRGQHRHDV